MGDRPAAGGVYPLPGVLPGRPPDSPPRHRRRDGRTRCLARLDRERNRVRLLRPLRALRGPLSGPEGHQIKEVLHERFSGPAEAVAPNGGRTGDVRDRLVVDENAESQDDLEPRTKRAVAEVMDVSLLSKGGRYEMQSASGNRYEVDVIDESCACLDWQQRSPEGGCKHLRRVNHEVKRGRVLRPDGRLPSPWS
jgi:hypothetical protein